MKKPRQTKKVGYSGKKAFWTSNLFAKRDLVYALICLVVILIILIVQFVSKKDVGWSGLIELKTFVSVVLVFVLNSFTNFIITLIQAKREDKLKLISDYNALLKMYVNTTPIVYKNKPTSNYKLGRRRTRCSHTESANNEDEYSIPLAGVVPFVQKNVTISDSQTMYKLPPKVESNMADIYKAHGFSTTYNQMNIRCDKIIQDNADNIEICFSRTTYLYSLVTNRAIDFKKNGISVRDLYAYGPYLPSLEQSQLSNHIGYNGFVETNDGYIIFILRHKHVSIAKNTLQSSVGASLKTRYALDNNMQVTKSGIVNAIRTEIEDELSLKNIDDYEARKADIFKELTFNSILCFYRELMEGGKPQFMFYTKINVSKDELSNAYQKGVSKINRRKTNMVCRIDGYKMLFVHKNNLKDIYITPDEMVIGRKAYKSVPSSTGTLALFIKYLDSGKIICK